MYASKSKGSKEQKSKTPTQPIDPFLKAFAGVRSVNEFAKTSSSQQSPQTKGPRRNEPRRNEPRRKKKKEKNQPPYRPAKRERESRNSIPIRATEKFKAFQAKQPESPEAGRKPPSDEGERTDGHILEEWRKSVDFPVQDEGRFPVRAEREKHARRTVEEDSDIRDEVDREQDTESPKQQEKPSGAAKMGATMAAIDKWLTPLRRDQENIFASFDSATKKMSDGVPGEQRGTKAKKVVPSESDEPEDDLDTRSANLVRNLRRLGMDSGLDKNTNAGRTTSSRKSGRRGMAGNDNSLPEEWEVQSADMHHDEAVDPEDGDEFGNEGDRDDSRVFKHALLHAEPLDVAALGRTIDALIINNPNILRVEREAPEVRPEFLPEPGPTIQWQEQVSNRDPSEVDPLSEDWNMLEAKRPDKDVPVTKKVYRKLVEYIMDGFTVRQLREYYTRKEREDRRLTRALEADYPWITSMGRWEGKVNYYVEGMTPKQRLVHEILTNIWKVEIKGDRHAVGWVPVYIKPDIVNILSQPTSTIIEDLKNDFLDIPNEEDVILDTESCKIDIFTKKWAVPAILNRLDRLLKAMVVAKIPTSSIDPSDLQRHILDELARATETNIRHLEKTKQLEVSWIPEEGEDLDFSPSPAASQQPASKKLALETPANVVVRLLKIKLDQPPTHESPVLALPSSDAVQARVAQTREKSSMSWRDRQRTWFRLYSAARSSGKETEDEEKPLQLLVPPPRSKGDVTNELSATFGHVLHLADGSKPASSAKESKSRLRILSPVTPHAAALTELTAGLSHVTRSTTIIVRFVARNDNAPEVQLRLPVEPGETLPTEALPDNATLSAVTPHYLQDVLLPRDSVDVRFQGTTNTSLDVASQPALKDFYAASELNLGEGLLHTPTNVSFNLPQNLVSLPPKPKSKPHNVTYLFAGAEVHQAVEAPWRGHALRFTNVAAGEHGGFRQELSLRSAAAAAAGGSSPEELARLAREVAEGRHFSWADGAELVRTLPPRAPADDDDPFPGEQVSFEEAVGDELAFEEAAAEKTTSEEAVTREVAAETEAGDEPAVAQVEAKVEVEVEQGPPDEEALVDEVKDDQVTTTLVDDNTTREPLERDAAPESDASR
ncbi:hypothetical protein N3K66_000093 [Trichothecium roseum]|uniref:Uncharacterized protein n=1 Tax=Trichothecium roseum TaxID=47278 RepID=A0ACC0VAZ7_9HYPO|nr:hypothetical protein N3K66_000093 [Trichothecium roseum]